ncbi:MAG: hypothetical protein HY094_05775 [Candidatus Melainabacteria bacterium]|nr:hypothetical protein [Candidatus Melainabacteria bacterium]
MKILPYILFISMLFLRPLEVKALNELPIKIDTPLKAALFYFPSPSVMRCLNHSNIPRVLRKAIIYRHIKFPHEPAIEETITIGTKNSKFIFAGNINKNREIIPFKIEGGTFFDLGKGASVKPSFLFGLEDLIGIQRKIHIKDKLGNQNLDYEIFLKTTKGMIGDLNYGLELFGQDRAINGAVKYFLSGKGQIGENKISVSGRELEQDVYKLNEEYGQQVEVITDIKVYD